MIKLNWHFKSTYCGSQCVNSYFQLGYITLKRLVYSHNLLLAVNSFICIGFYKDAAMDDA